jgi:hypothetical protein
MGVWPINSKTWLATFISKLPVNILCNKEFKNSTCCLKATRSLQNSLSLNAAVLQKERKVGFAGEVRYGISEILILCQQTLAFKKPFKYAL